ncbi:MAG TPA: hypothetical protein VIK93_04935 [Limnochordales bacterium]
MRAAVQRAWVLHNMEKIGPGGFYHLAYAHHQISPGFMEAMRAASHYGKIHVCLLADDGTALDAADGEVIAIHWFPEFIRIHFMIENLRPLTEAPRVPWPGPYMLMR